ncbi:MAG: hypothetical protein LBM04_01225 [Opitutaceae bacterium]|jgi:hypothetical protein|nr:hypothetical protein [Opitutaceae bacterium]
MNDLRISLSRIIAINWYGFRKIIDVDDDILVSGATGTGKSALIDLVQYVLLGDRWKANRAATGNAGGRDLAGYCLGDTNTMRDGERHFLRPSGASFIGLEWTWPEGRGKKEPRRETWGMRIEFASPNAKPKHLYFRVPARLEMADITSGGRLVSDDDFRLWLRRENGSNYNQCVFPTQTGYLEEMAHRNHLAFDRNAFARTLPKAIAFELDKNVETFIRNFLLEENPLDVREVKTALGAYEEINTRLRRQEKEAEFLRKIHDLHSEFETSMRKAAVHRHAAIMLKLAQEEERRDKAATEIERLEKNNKENIAKRDKADARIKTLDDILAKARQDPDAVNLGEEIKKRDTLEQQIEQLRSARRSTQKRLDARHHDWTRWLRDGGRLTLPGIAEKLNLVDHAYVSALGNAADTEENRFAAMRQLAYTFSNQLTWEISPILEEQKREIGSLEKKLTKIKDSIGKLDQGEMTGDFPVLETIRRQLGNRDAASQLARYIEVRPDAEKWWPALETLLDDNRHTIVLKNAEDYARALAALRSATPGDHAEHLLNPNEIPLPPPAHSVTKASSPDSLAQKITVEHPAPAIHAFVQKLIGDVHCAEDTAALDAVIKNGAPAAVTPDGHFARPPLRRRLQSGETVALTLGKAGLERVRKRLLAQRGEIKGEKEKLERQYHDASDWLNQARERFRLGDTDLPDYTDEIAKLPGLEEGLLQAKSTVEMLSVREDVVKRQQELARHEKDKDSLVGKLALLNQDIAGYSMSIQPHIDARDSANGKIATLTIDIAASRANLGKNLPGISDADLITTRDTLRARFPKSWTDAIGEAGQLATEADGAANTAKANRNNERRFLATARDENGENSFPLNATYSDPEYDPETNDNTLWDARLKVLEQIEIKRSREQAESCRAKWEDLLQKRVLQGLKDRTENARRTIDDLRKCLRTPIRGLRYNITQSRDTRNYATIWSLLNTGLNPDDPLSAAVQDPQVADAKKMLRDAINGFDDPNASKTHRALLDYRNYHNYDITFTPADRENAAPISLGKKLGNLSGGENQAPFFISMLAAFRRVYASGDLSSQRAPHIGLVVMDEAFSKLSGDGIEDCLELARNFQLQLLMAFPPERLGVMLPHAETVIVCRKEEERGPDGYITRIDNIAIPLPMKEALDILS